MSDELTKNRQFGNSDASPDKQVLPKVYANFNHYNDQFNWVNHKKMEMQSEVKTLSPKVSQNNSNNKPFSDAYLAAFNELEINDNNKSLDMQIQAGKRKVSWLGVMIGLILLLLGANLYFMATPYYKSKQFNSQNKASLEFEAVVPLPGDKIDNETSSNSEPKIIPYMAQELELPKKRVLIISEDTRNELLKQLDDDAALEEPEDKLNEYFPN